jgi:hypothetical protein
MQFKKNVRSTKYDILTASYSLLPDQFDLILIIAGFTGVKVKKVKESKQENPSRHVGFRCVQ